MKRDTTLPNNPAQLIKDHEKEISDQIGIEKRKDTGGIDFTPPQIHLETKIESDKGMLHVGYGIQFHIDPAILQQLKDAPGFVPVIINIQPMRNLKSFLETR